MKILIMSYNKFPNDDAGAVRDYTFGKMLNELGHHVCVVSMGENTDFDIKNYNGLEYISLRNKGVDKVSRIFNYYGYTQRMFSFINDYYSDILPEVIWVVNIPFHSLLSVKKFALKNNIRLIYDRVEWYSPKQFKYGFFSPTFIINEITNRIIVDRTCQVISISKFFDDYYSRKKINSLRIPIVFDKFEMAPRKNVCENKLVLMYAGSPGRKDYLYTMVKSLSYLSVEMLKKIEFRIIGVNESDLRKLFRTEEKTLKKIINSLDIRGRVTRDEVLNNLVQTDFTVLLRNPKLRYAKAGFPTKFVESMASGTPIISNISSDLADYLDDMNNSIIVSKCDSKSFAEAIGRAYDLKFKIKNITAMYENSRLTFEKYFHYEEYMERLELFIKGANKMSP